MPTRTEIGILAVATIIGAVCALIGVILKAVIGFTYDIGFGLPMWVGMLLFLAPITGGFFSFISSLIAISQTERKRIIFSVSAAVGFLVGCLPFNYMTL